MSRIRVDLHCHSTFSDGTLTPMELLDQAHELGLQGISITDHDTVEAYNSELFDQAGKLGLILIPGIEISSTFHGANVHILGYGYDLKDMKFRTFIEKIQKKRIARNQAMLKKLADQGMPIEESELTENVFGTHVIGRPHIAQMMVKKGYVESFEKAFELFIKDDACCYVSGEKFSSEEVILQIHKAKGKAVLAHPHLIKNSTLTARLLKLQFDGIEGYYGSMPAHIEKKWIQAGKERGWIVTGGSDFHGWIKPHIQLGASWIDGTVVDQILSR